MNFQFYLEKLLNSSQFKKFKKENKEAYFCSGFFSIDKQGNDNQQHFDFYVPSNKKLFSFQMEKGIELMPLEDYDTRIPEKLKEDFDFDFNKVEELILNEMEKEKIKNQIHKLLFSLQNLNKKKVLVGTIFISGMGILKVTIDVNRMQVIDFEKKSFFDMLKVLKK